MQFDFKKVMKENSDEELVKILTVRRADYQEDAIVAAQNELQSRNLSEEKKDSYRIVAEENLAREVKKAGEPLETHLKMLTVIFPMIITFILSGFYKSNGYDKRAKEVVMWTIVGFAFYFVFITALIILGGL